MKVQSLSPITITEPRKSGQQRRMTGAACLCQCRITWRSRRVYPNRPDFQSYAAKYHTSTTQLAELATKAKPRLLIIYHASIVLRPALRPQSSSPDQLLKEVLSGYAGEVVVARDLDVY